MSRSLGLLLAIGLIIIVGIGGQMWREGAYGTGPQASATPPSGETREIAFVANAVGGTVSLVDVADRAVIGTLDVLPDGDSVGLFRDPIQAVAQSYVQGRTGLNYAQDTDLSRDGRVLFVSRGYLGDVAAFDIASGAIIWRTQIAGLRSDHMDLSPDGTRLYVSAVLYGGNRVEVLDTETGDTLGSVTAGQWPHDVHVSPDGARIYTASLGDMLADLPERDQDADAYLVTVHDTETLERVTAYEFDAGIRPFVMTRDGGTIYAQLSNTHAIVAHDLASNTQTGRVDLPVADGVSEEDWDFDAPHHGLAMTGDDATLCVAGRASDYAGIVAAPSLSVEATIPVGDAPSWAVLAQDDSLCLLPNTRSDDVSIIDLATRAEIARLKVGEGPKHISVGAVPVEVIGAVTAP